MAKIDVITPIHIASGFTYSAYTYNKMVYDLGYILTLCPVDKCQNPDILCKAGNLSNKEFIDKLNVDKTKIEKSHAISKIEQIEITGIVSEHVKTLDQLIIPGSTIKGYIMNVLWYDIISSNEKIKNYLISQYEKIDNNSLKKSKFEKCKKNNHLFQNVIYMQELLEINDVIFDNNLEINLCQRYKKYNGTLSIKNYIEVLPVNSSWEGSLYKLKDSYSSKIVDIIGEKIQKQIEKNENNEIRKLELELFAEIKHRLNKSNFESWFKDTNKKFMLKIMEKEVDFIEGCCNKDIDIKNIRLIYNEIIESLNKNEIIIQIGKYTNFLLKSFDTAFGSYYNKKFQSLFSPMDNKKEPKLDTINLIKKDELGSIPLGFLKIKL